MRSVAVIETFSSCGQLNSIQKFQCLFEIAMRIQTFQTLAECVKSQELIRYENQRIALCHKYQKYMKF